MDHNHDNNCQIEKIQNKTDFSTARIIEVHKNSFVVSDGEHEIPAELSGKFLYEIENTVDYPTVGDCVEVQIFDNFTLAIIHNVLPRNTLLKRKEAGKRIEFQLIAANIDFGLVLQAANHVNLNLLDRYFVMLNESGIEPIAVFSKIDLLSEVELESLTNMLSKLKKEYLLISNMEENGVIALSDKLQKDKTYCLLGPSGVGKTSLLNRLLHTNAYEVKEVREKDGKGRHTTVRRQLTTLEGGSIMIDTPGMRELGNFQIDQGLDQTFDEFAHYAMQCAYRDCTHSHEAGCAIIQAVQDGKIEESRYQNYLKLRKEADYYDMSYQEKRKKDKAFGKNVKNYKKNFRSNTNI